MPKKSVSKVVASSSRSIRTRALVSLGVLLLVVSGWLWWTKIYRSPRNVFNNMLRSSLSTSSVTRHMIEKSPSGGQDQYTQLSFGSDYFAHILNTTSQKDPSGQDNRVTTESIGTPKADYARYVTIQTSQKNEAGKIPNYASVQNVWGKGGEAVANQPAAARYFQQAVFGIVPMGNLNSGDRGKLLKQIQDTTVYTVDYSKVQKQSLNGRRVYVYTVSIKPQAYVRMLLSYAQMVGIKNVDGLDPASYSDATPITLSFSVGITSHQLARISYPNQEAGSVRQEDYDGYGGSFRLQLPTRTISFDELQAKVQAVQ